jgi:hypothetical protein
MIHSKDKTFFFAPYSCQEGFSIYNYLQTQYDISNSIIKYKNSFEKLNKQSDIFSKDILDTSGNVLPKNTLNDARIKDIHTILIQENTLYMIGVITTASLIIAAIIISK